MHISGQLIQNYWNWRIHITFLLLWLASSQGIVVLFTVKTKAQLCSRVCEVIVQTADLILQIDLLAEFYQRNLKKQRLRAEYLKIEKIRRKRLVINKPKWKTTFFL